MAMNIIDENKFYEDAALKDGLYVVRDDEKLYFGVAKGEKRVDTGISSDFLNHEDFALSAWYGIEEMETGLESYWTIQSDGKVEKRDSSATVYTSPEFKCGGYANEDMVIVLKKTDNDLIHGLMITYNKESGKTRYVSSESKEPQRVSGAKTIEEVLSKIGLGALLKDDAPKTTPLKGRNQEYIIV